MLDVSALSGPSLLGHGALELGKNMESGKSGCAFPFFPAPHEAVTASIEQTRMLLLH